MKETTSRFYKGINLSRPESVFKQTAGVILRSLFIYVPLLMFFITSMFAFVKYVMFDINIPSAENLFFATEVIVFVGVTNAIFKTAYGSKNYKYIFDNGTGSMFERAVLSVIFMFSLLLVNPGILGNTLASQTITELILFIIAYFSITIVSTIYGLELFRQAPQIIKVIESENQTDTYTITDELRSSFVSEEIIAEEIEIFHELLNLKVITVTGDEQLQAILTLIKNGEIKITKVTTIYEDSRN